MAYNPNSTSFAKVYYTVNTTGDTWFTPTIQASDSPDYTANKTQALAQCGRMMPTTHAPAELVPA